MSRPVVQLLNVRQTAKEVCSICGKWPTSKQRNARVQIVANSVILHEVHICRPCSKQIAATARVS